MLKILKLQKQRTALQAQLTQLRAKRKQLRTDEEAMKKRLDAAADVPPELAKEIDDLTEAQTQTDDAIADVQDQIDTLTEQISQLEGDPDPDPEPDPTVDARSNPPAARRAAPVSRCFRCRSRAFSSRGDMESFYVRSEVKDFLQRLRDLGASGRRAVTGAELNIPTVMLELIRDNLGEYSKLISKVRLRPINGAARQNITGTIPEAVWMEMRGALDELEFAFNQIEVDGYKVGGYIPVSNTDLADSDINLGEEITSMLLYSIGYALDKAIVYGKGSGSKMPLGIVTRLAESSQPSYWGSNQGTWTDLHTSNVLKLNIVGSTGMAFFQALLAALGKVSPKYTTAKPVWCVNHLTHMDLLGRGLCFTSDGTLKSGLGSYMPVDDGDIVELDFMPDYEIAGGYLDLYVLAEREGGSVAQSEHVRFLQDETVFRGTARYDGKPVRGEAFVVVNYNNTNVTTAKDFAVHYAATDMNVLICTAAEGSATGKTVVTVSGAKAASPTLKYAVLYGGEINVGDEAPSDFATLTSGTTAITAAAGAVVTVIELDSGSRIVSKGSVISIPKSA